MGKFSFGDKNNPVNLIKIETDWKIDDKTIPTPVTIVDGAQLTTPDGVTLTFKKGTILLLQVAKRLCIYRNKDLKKNI